MNEEKFEKLVADTTTKMGDKNKIDFKNSDIDKGKNKVKISAKSSYIDEEKENRTCRHAISLTPTENEDFLDTLERLEKPSVKMREIILDYIKQWKRKNKR